MEYLEAAAQITVLASFLAAAFSYAVLQPRNAETRRLKEAIDRLSAKLDRIDERLRAHEIGITERITEVEQRVKSAQHRLDTVEKRLGIQRGDGE